MRRSAGPNTPRAEALKRRLSRPAESGPAPQKIHRFARAYARLHATSAQVRNVVFLVGAAAVFVYLWHEVRDTSIYIEPLSVPATLADRGLTSVVLTDRVVGRIHSIAKEMGGSTGAPEIRSANDVQEFRVLAFGPSVQSIGRQLRRAIGRTDGRVAGAITRNETAWRIAVRVSESQMVCEMKVPNVEPLDEALTAASAIAIMRITSPYALIEYQYSTYFRTRDPESLSRLEETLNFREGMTSDGGGRYVRYMRALVSFERGDYRLAQQSYAQLARDYPDWTKAKSMAAMAAIAAQRYGDANALLDEVIRSSETRPAQLAHAAITLADMGRTRDAYILNLRILRSDPSNVTARLNVADLLTSGLHRPVETIALLHDWAPSTESDIVRARWLLARSYFHIGDLDKLRETGALMARQHSGDWRTLSVAVWEAEARGDWGEAKRLSGQLDEKLRSASDTSFMARTSLARALLHEGSLAAVIALLEPLAANDSVDTDVRVLLAKAYSSSGQLSAANAEYEKVNAVDPDHVGALKGWGDVLARLGRPDDARGKAEMAEEAAKRLSVPLDVPVLRKP